MYDAERKILLARPVKDLQKAAGIAGGDDRSAGGFDVAELAIEEIARHFRLDQIVDAGATAAPCAFRQFDKFEIGDGPEHGARLGGDFLAVAEVTRLVVGDGLRRR